MRPTLARSFPHLLLALALGACDQFEDPDIAQIRSIEPDSGSIGSLVIIQAENLFNNTRVIFEDEVASPIAILFADERVVTIVPENARSGDVVLETGGERSSSRASFTVVPPPPSTPPFFEDDTGQVLAAFTGGCGLNNPADDGFVPFTLPFAFPFYGRPQAEMFVTTNGLITFGQPRPCDNSGQLQSFANADKIAVANLDLDPGSGGRVLVDAADPERVVVTWSEVALCGLPVTSNTFQAVLHADGRIRMNFGYFSTRGIGTGCTPNLVTGTLTGIAPVAAAGLTQVTYTAQPSFTAGPQEAVVSPFFVGRLFDLENRALLFTPVDAEGVFNGYRVELITPE